MSTPVTCTFKVPTSSDEFAYIGENGIGIKFSHMLDPTNAVFTRTESMIPLVELKLIRTDTTLDLSQ